MRPARLLIALLMLLAATRPTPAAEVGVTADSSFSVKRRRWKALRRRSVRVCGKVSLPAFAEVNAKGGIHGRKLNLISRDDGYDPDRSMVQTIKLIEQDQVFALIGAVGTPTSKATMPIAAANNVPLSDRSVAPISCALRSSTTSQYPRELQR